MTSEMGHLMKEEKSEDEVIAKVVDLGNVVPLVGMSGYYLHRSYDR